MARLRVGGPVPGRKVRPNPQTCSGYPQWNTFSGLGQVSVARELRIQASKDGVKCGSIARHKHRLHPDNVMHRVRPGEQIRLELEAHFNKARVLSLEIDHEELEGVLDAMLKRYNMHVQALKGSKWLVKLIRLEAARGVVRAVRA